MPLCLKYFSMKIKKTTLSHFFIVAVVLLPFRNHPINEDLIHGALSLCAVMAGAGLFYVIHRDTGKSLLKGTHARSPDVQNREKAIARYRDFEKKVPVYDNALTSLQKRLESARASLGETTIATEDKNRLNEWAASTTECLNKIASGQSYSGAADFDEHFARIFNLSDSGGNSLIEKYESIPFFDQLRSLPLDTDYALVLETQVSVQELHLPVDLEAVRKKIGASEQAIEQELEKKVGASLDKIEREHPYIDTLIKTTPEVVIAIGSVIINQEKLFNTGGGDK